MIGRAPIGTLSIGLVPSYGPVDSTLPTQTGTLTASSITTTSYTLTAPTGADDVGVAGYEFSLDNQATWIDNGNDTTYDATGRTPSTTDLCATRCYDAAGNRSTPALTASVTLDSLPMGTITTPQMANNTPSVLASETGIIFNVYNPTTGALVVQKTGQTSDTSGVVTVADVSITAGSTYRYVLILSSGDSATDVAVAT